MDPPFSSDGLASSDVKPLLSRTTSLPDYTATPPLLCLCTDSQCNQNFKSPGFLELLLPIPVMQRNGLALRASPRRE